MYALVNPINNEIRYVGKTTQSLTERLSKHLHDSLKNKHKTACWIKSLKKLDMTPNIVELDFVVNDSWIECEQFWIMYFKFLGANLTNHTKGGEGLIGHAHSEETKNKLKNALTGRSLSKEHKEKLHLAGLGRKHTEETKQKLRIKHLGKKMSNEARSKMKNNNLGKILTEEHKNKIRLSMLKYRSSLSK